MGKRIQDPAGRAQPVSPDQRFTAGNPCPICRGRGDAPKGAPDRCWGYLTGDGRYAYCSRVESSFEHQTIEGTWRHPVGGPNGRANEVEDGLIQRELLRQEGGDDRVIEYVYRSLEGRLIRRKLRFADGSKRWAKGPKVEVPYRLPELVEGATAGEEVWIVDGEKDVEALRRRGVVATCAPNSMGSWRAEYSEFLSGAAKAVIVQDKDDGPGRKQALQVKELLRAAVSEIAVVQAATGKDASDHLEAGRGLEDFVPTAPSTWAPVDLGPVLRGEQVERPPSVLARTDGPCLVYRGKVHNIYGEPEAGKGWVALLACAEQLRAGEKVVYIDFEADASTVVSRLESLGASDEEVLDRFVYIRPDESRDLGRDDLEATLKPSPALVILDGLTEALALEDVDIKDNTGVANWIRELPRRLAHSLQAAVVIIDHVPHEADRMIGAQHKKAGIDVAYHLRVTEAFGRGQSGKAKLKVTKDRPGHVRLNALDPKKKESDIADIVLEDIAPGAVRMHVAPPTSWAPLTTMQSVSDRLEAEGGLSQTVLRERVGVKKETLLVAINKLEELGCLERRGGGKGKPTYHYLLKPYRPEE